MKKLFCLALFISILAWSCKKETQDTSASAYELRKALTNLAPHLQKKLFRSQAPEVKAAIWKDKFENILMHEWTPAQLKLIHDIHQQIVPALFVDGNTANVHFTNTFNPKWKRQLPLAFTAAQADNLFARLEDVGISQRAITGDPDCYCSVNDDWCIGKTCEWGGCNIQNWGCGTVWIYYCTGLCH
jgi:hypothetical protein